MANGLQRLRIFVAGRVQGVGFRFFVEQLATEMALAGWVRNSGLRVEIEVQGQADSLPRFLERLKNERPRGSSIDALETSDIPAADERGFKIASSV